MKDQKISTILGSIILIIIATTVTGFVLLCFKNYPVKNDIIPTVIPQQLVQESGVIIDEPVENWTICKNIKAKYLMKYPSSWERGINGPYGFESKKDCNIENVRFGKYKLGSGYEYYIDIESISMEGTEAVYKNSVSLEDFFSKRPGIIENSPIIEAFILDNEKAVYLEKSPNLRVYVFHNHRIFEIFGKNISQKTFNDLLSTFKFLD
jgi:hypothetical protein